MNNALLFTAFNVNLTLVYRMIQRESPLTIRLHRIKQHETPFGNSLECMKILFTTVTIFMGVPVAFLWGSVIFIPYMVYWYVTVLWWKYFASCNFDKCTFASVVPSILLLLCMTYFFNTHPVVVYTWMVPLWWSCYTSYLSIWYKHSYAKTSFILS